MFRLGRLTRLILAAGIALLAGPGLAAAESPFGVMLFPNPGEDFSLVLARARGLGVAWFRPPTIALGQWSSAAPCLSCAVYLRSGLKLAITIRNVDDTAMRQTAHPPAHPDAFLTAVKNVVGAWRPSLVAVESEENAGSSYQGAPAAYLAELKAACDVVHKAGALCANGGITGAAAATLTWLDFLAQGHVERACDFSQRALPGEELCAYHKPDEVPPAVRDRLLGGADQLLALYRAAPIDLVNFHWFGGDLRAFAEVANYLAHAAGKPAMTNEFGQRPGADANGVRPLLRAVVGEGVRVAIWYSVDTADTMSLFGKDGRLRLGGWEFQRQLAGLR